MPDWDRRKLLWNQDSARPRTCLLRAMLSSGAPISHSSPWPRHKSARNNQPCITLNSYWQFQRVMPYPKLRCASTLCGIHCATIRASRNFRRKRSHESWELSCRAEAVQQAMSAGNEQRKLAAIMFTDMVGYAALAQRDDKLALELLEEHRQLLREIF